MVTYDDFDVTVIIGGAPCVEYEHDRTESVVLLEDNKTRIRYIQALDGAEFTIFHSAKHKSPGLQRTKALSVQVIVDGEEQVCAIAFKKNNFRTLIRGRHSQIEGKPYEQKFYFGNLIKSDGDDCTPSTARHNGRYIAALGTIEVNIYRVSYTKQEIKERKTSRKTAKVNDTVRNEVATKHGFLSHHTLFGAPKERRKHKVYQSKYIDSRENPFRSFKFLYRSAASLRALGMLPPLATADTGDRDETEEFRNSP